ncbi:MAG: tRNA (N(6)-L-threonylcarbamoyladenosine(37)-C(2))-methylthiotransferase MtaB [Candidatus Falkowbacteria bacterium]|nr:tRNA (N(6)-L-threonylcarbamoyladenosine(37)-C(2))-methylthiotransferase MtaB [Candidatus Falkowbacteria bacterium]
MNYKFFIQSLGCKVNQYDGAALAASLESLGFCQSELDPDLVVINTCTVTKNAIAKDRQLLNNLKRKYPEAKLVVMGCWPQTSKDNLGTFDNEGIFWWGVGRNDEFLAMVKDWFSLKDQSIESLESGLALTNDWSRYFLKVGDGCNQFCAYCLIPYARGRIKSRPLDELVSEARRAMETGLSEIVLAGIHLGRYGQDFQDGKTSLNNLLRALLALPGLGRIRLSSIEINEVDDELVSLMKNNSKICCHLHISLQSGCDKILSAMRRPYDTEYFRQRVDLIRRELPDMAITTDIIVGFPGEEEKDFLDTVEFSREIGFSKIHVFPFSAHEKTPAFSMENQVITKEIKSRAKTLRDLSLKMEAKYRQEIIEKYQGQLLPVVLEAIIGNKARLKTEFYFDFLLPLSSIGFGVETAEKNIGKLLTIKI